MLCISFKEILCNTHPFPGILLRHKCMGRHWRVEINQWNVCGSSTQHIKNIAALLTVYTQVAMMAYGRHCKIQKRFTSKNMKAVAGDYVRTCHHFHTIHAKFCRHGYAGSAYLPTTGTTVCSSRATTAAQDADILNATKASPFSTAREIGEATGVSASTSTIKRRLAERKLKIHVAAQKPPCQTRRRVLTSQQNTSPGPRTTAKQYFFSDESTFTTRWDQKQRVWRPVDARYDPLYVQEVASSGRTAVNVWGAVSRDGLGVLHRIEGPLTSAKYCDILNYVMIPYTLDGPFLMGTSCSSKTCHLSTLQRLLKSSSTCEGCSASGGSPKGQTSTSLRPYGAE